MGFLKKDPRLDLFATIRENADQYPDAPALIQPHETRTWGQLHQELLSYIRMVSALKIREDDRVMVSMHGRKEHVLVLLALMTTGAWIIPVDIKQGERYVAETINESAPSFVFLSSSLYDVVRRPEYLFSLNARFIIQQDEVEVREPGENEQLLNQLLEPVASDEQPLARLQDSSRLVFFFRNRKGKIIGAQFNIQKLLAQAMKVRRRFQLMRTDTVFCQLSLSHYATLSNMILPALFSASALVLMERSESDERVLEMLSRHTPKLMVNTRKYYYILMKHMREQDLTGHMEYAVMINDGYPVPWLNDFEQCFQCHLIPGFASPLIAGFVTLALHFLPRRPNSAGYPLIGTNYLVVDEKGDEVTVDEWGEVVIHSPYMLDEFYNRRDAGSEYYGTKYVRTQQMALQDTTGALYLADEVREVIWFRGFKISPLEVEEALLKMDSVEDVAAVNNYPGQPESIIAFVKCAEDCDFSEDRLRTTARELLPAYLQPSQYYRVDKIPYSIEDRKLRDEVKNKMERVVLGGRGESS